MKFTRQLLRRAAAALALGLAGLTGVALAAKPAPTASASAESPALRALLDRQVGQDPAQEFHLSAALAALDGAKPAAALRRHLLHAYLRQAAQEPLLPVTSVREAIAAAATALPVESDPQALARWEIAVNRSFALTWRAQAVALPPELEASRKNLREVGPGLWSDHQADGRTRGFIWRAVLRNRSALALPLGEFRLHPVGRPPYSMLFNCSLPRYAESTVPAAGQDTAYLCRAAASLGPEHPAYAQFVRQFTGQAPVEWRIEPRDLIGSASAEALVGRLEKLARERTDALLATTADCPSGGDCAPAKAAAGAEARASVPGDPRWSRIRSHLHIAGTALGMLLAYAFLVRLIGRGGASVVAVVLGWIGSASWMMAGRNGEVFTIGSYAGTPGALVMPLLLIGIAAIGPLVAVAVIATVHELVFGDRERVLRDLHLAFVRSIAEGLVEVLLGRRRRR